MLLDKVTKEHIRITLLVSAAISLSAVCVHLLQMTLLIASVELPKSKDHAANETIKSISQKKEFPRDQSIPQSTGYDL